MADPTVFVMLAHAIITFILCNDFARIFDDNLVGLKTTIAPDTMPAIKSLDDLNPNIVLTTGFCSLS